MQYRYFVSLLRLCGEICSGNNAAAAAVVAKSYPFEAILLFLETAVTDSAGVRGVRKCSFGGTALWSLWHCC